MSPRRKKGGRPPEPISPADREAELHRAAVRHGEGEIEYTPKVHVPPRELDKKQGRR